MADNTAAEQYDETGKRWIQCDSSTCNKWRLLPEAYVSSVQKQRLVWRCDHVEGGGCEIACSWCPLPLCDCGAASAGARKTAVWDVPGSSTTCHVASGSRGFAHFRPFLKFKPGGPYVEWMATCPQCQVQQMLDINKARGGHDHRSLQTFLERHRTHAEDFVDMTLSLSFAVPPWERMLYQERAAQADTSPGSSSDTDALVLDADPLPEVAQPQPPQPHTAPPLATQSATLLTTESLCTHTTTTAAETSAADKCCTARVPADLARVQQQATVTAPSAAPLGMSAAPVLPLRMQKARSLVTPAASTTTPTAVVTCNAPQTAMLPKSAAAMRELPSVSNASSASTLGRALLCSEQLSDSASTEDTAIPDSCPTPAGACIPALLPTTSVAAAAATAAATAAAAAAAAAAGQSIAAASQLAKALCSAAAGEAAETSGPAGAEESATASGHAGDSGNATAQCPAAATSPSATGCQGTRDNAAAQATAASLSTAAASGLKAGPSTSAATSTAAASVSGGLGMQASPAIGNTASATPGMLTVQRQQPNREAQLLEPFGWDKRKGLHPVNLAKTTPAGLKRKSKQPERLIEAPEGPQHGQGHGSGKRRKRAQASSDQGQPPQNEQVALLDDMRHQMLPMQPDPSAGSLQDDESSGSGFDRSDYLPDLKRVGQQATSLQRQQQPLLAGTDDQPTSALSQQSGYSGVDQQAASFAAEVTDPMDVDYCPKSQSEGQQASSTVHKLQQRCTGVWCARDIRDFYKPVPQGSALPALQELEQPPPSVPEADVAVDTQHGEAATAQPAADTAATLPPKPAIDIQRQRTDATARPVAETAVDPTPQPERQTMDCCPGRDSGTVSNCFLHLGHAAAASSAAAQHSRPLHSCKSSHSIKAQHRTVEHAAHLPHAGISSSSATASKCPKAGTCQGKRSNAVGRQLPAIASNSQAVQHSRDQPQPCQGTQSSTLAHQQRAGASKCQAAQPSWEQQAPCRAEEQHTGSGASAAQTMMWAPTAGHTIYDEQQCCQGWFSFDDSVREEDLPPAVLSQRVRDKQAESLVGRPKRGQRRAPAGRLLWEAAYPSGKTCPREGDSYSKAVEFLREQFGNITLPEHKIPDVLAAVAYGSKQVKASGAQHWLQIPNASTSGQFILSRELPTRRKLLRIVSSMLFHIQEAEQESGHATVQILFAATVSQHRRQKFFVQLLRLFMQEYLLKHFKSVDLLVMASPVEGVPWGTASLAQQLGTERFTPLRDDDPLVQGRVKCTDCHWMHMRIDQWLLQSI